MSIPKEPLYPRHANLPSGMYVPASAEQCSVELTRVHDELSSTRGLLERQRDISDERLIEVRNLRAELSGTKKLLEEEKKYHESDHESVVRLSNNIRDLEADRQRLHALAEQRAKEIEELRRQNDRLAGHFEHAIAVQEKALQSLDKSESQLKQAREALVTADGILHQESFQWADLADIIRAALETSQTYGEVAQIQEGGGVINRQGSEREHRLVRPEDAGVAPGPRLPLSRGGWVARPCVSCGAAFFGPAIDGEYRHPSCAALEGGEK